MAAWSWLADAYGAWTTKPRSTRVPDVASNLNVLSMYSWVPIQQRSREK